MSYNLPERKTEQAFKAYFGAITGLAIRTRFSGAVKSLPELVILCDNVDPAMRAEDNTVVEWACDVKFTIRTRYEKADEAEGQAHDIFVGAIADMINDSGVVDGLNEFKSLLDMTAILWKPNGRRARANEKDLETEMTGTLWMVQSET